VSVGFETSVISRVGSVTSTFVRSSLGDMRILSAAMVALSSGGSPGQTSTTMGLSAANTDQAAQADATR